MTTLGASALPRRFSASMSASGGTCVLPESAPDGTLVEGDEGEPPSESPPQADAAPAMAAARRRARCDGETTGTAMSSRREGVALRHVRRAKASTSARQAARRPARPQESRLPGSGLRIPTLTRPPPRSAHCSVVEGSLPCVTGCSLPCRLRFLSRLSSSFRWQPAIRIPRNLPAPTPCRQRPCRWAQPEVRARSRWRREADARGPQAPARRGSPPRRHVRLGAGHDHGRGRGQCRDGFPHGSLTVAGQSVSVTQQGLTCSYVVSPQPPAWRA